MSNQDFVNLMAEGESIAKNLMYGRLTSDEVEKADSRLEEITSILESESDEMDLNYG